MKKCEVLLDIPSIRGKVQMQKKKKNWRKRRGKSWIPKRQGWGSNEKKKLWWKEGECEAGEGDGSSGKKTLR